MAATPKPVVKLDQSLVEDLSLPVSGRIANLLERAILEGQYQPGQRLREVELANQLGVSAGLHCARLFMPLRRKASSKSNRAAGLS